MVNISKHNVNKTSLESLAFLEAKSVHPSPSLAYATEAKTDINLLANSLLEGKQEGKSQSDRVLKRLVTVL